MTDFEPPKTPREVFETTTCYGKNSYDSPQSAHRRLSETERKSKSRNRKKRRGKSKLGMYRCKVCHMWHLGSVDR